MKQIIMDVLDDMSDSQINLASETARETVTSLISAALKTKGSYKEYTEYELDEQKAREYWVCGVCGKSTFDVEDDYLVHPKLHLGCALEEEAKGKDIKEQYLEASEKYFDDDSDENVKFRNKIFEKQKQAYNEMTSDGLPEGGDTQAVLESRKLAEET